MKAYKIFKQQENGLQSAVVPDRFSLSYSRDNKTHAPNRSKIFIFEDRGVARNWMVNILCDGELWEIEAGDNIYLIDFIPYLSPDSSTSLIDTFWNAWSNENGFIIGLARKLQRASQGTVLCDWVKPIELIERADE